MDECCQDTQVETVEIDLSVNTIQSSNCSITKFEHDVLVTSEVEDIPTKNKQDSNCCNTTLDLEFQSLTTLKIENTEKIENLRISGNLLEHLPDLTKLTRLKTLHANENKLISLPDSLHHLVNLEDLQLIGNHLVELNPSVCCLKSLRKIVVDENSLRTLPAKIGCLKSLRVLEACYNKLDALPDGLCDLRLLTALNISNNSIKYLPADFGNLSSLCCIDISDNKISLLPETFQAAPILEKFHADSNQICILPSWFASLPKLMYLTMRDNLLQGSPLPDNFGETSVNLKTFDFAGNSITSLPSSFGSLVNLEYVHMGSVIGELERRGFQNGNWILELPELFGNLTSLTELHLDENRLCCLPEDFGSLCSLEEVDFGQNMIHELPKSFVRLRSLRKCLLSQNHIKMLPEGFGELQALRELRLDNNEIAELPVSFDALVDLEYLDLFRNKLTAIPTCIKLMDKLVGLDIDENCIKVLISEIPKIFRGNKYAERNPDFSNNWRGKKRADHYNPVIEEVSFSCEDAEAVEEVPEDSEWSSQLLQQAARDAVATWRNKPEESDDDPGVEDDEAVAEYSDEEPVDEYHRYSYSSTDDTEDGSEESPPEAVICDSNAEPENWDNELDTGPYEEEYTYVHPLPVKPSRFLFVPSINHPDNLQLGPVFMSDMQPGQFDDVE